MAKLRTITVSRGESSKMPLLLHFSVDKKMHDAASALRHAGFQVDGLYTPAATLNPSPDEAVVAAEALLG